VSDRASDVADAVLSDAACLVDGRERDLVEALDASAPAGDPEELLLHLPGAGRGSPGAFLRDEVALALERVRRVALPPEPDAADRILGVSSAIDRVREQVRSVAAYPDVAVLVLGATGTGKECVAQAIHELSFDRDAPFIAVNCAALPEHLVESELFGHEAGAFTGARGPRVGLMEAAAGGTLFLDEIGEMPLALQGKLLRALESRRFRPVGSNRDVELKARVVSATHRRSQMTESVRKDLFFRLAGFTIRLPKLSARPMDLPVLADHFLRSFAARYHREPRRLLDRACDELERHSWPGNVRELRAVVEHAAILAGPAPIEAAHVRMAFDSRLSMPPSTLPPPMRLEMSEASNPAPPPRAEPRSLQEMERELIEQALREHEGNVSRSARTLGIPRSTLRDKLRRYGLG
jgi:DNA-binding NtrC family response regulator